MHCFDSILIAFDAALGSVLTEVQAAVVWLSIGCLGCSGIRRTPHGISVGLYPLLSLLTKVACSLTSSAGLSRCGPCVLKVGSTEKSVAMRSCVLAFWYTHFCLLCCALRSICVCQYTTNAVSVSMVHCIYWLYLLVDLEVVQSFCCVRPHYRQREGLQPPLLMEYMENVS